MIRIQMIIAAVAITMYLPAADPSSSVRGVDISSSGPVVIPNTQRFDFTSRVNGTTYRVFVAAPVTAVAGRPCRVLYILDGNLCFPTAAMALSRASLGGAFPPAIIVGVGYPDDQDDVLLHRRSFDMTDSVSAGTDTPTGGADTFIRVILEEIKPFVTSRYTVDAKHQAIFGKSLGGLAVARILFRSPTAFDTYILSSPSLWWNKHSVLNDEPAFAERMKTTSPHIRVLILSAENEQYRGSDVKRLREPRLVDDASGLASRLAMYAPGSLDVRYVVFQDESHWSVTEAAISRAIRFSFAD